MENNMYFEKINPKVWDDDIWLKHIYHEGSRSHVLSWNNKGSHCKEKNCIMNAPDEVMTKATVEGKSIHIFIETKHRNAYSSKTVMITKVTYV